MKLFYSLTDILNGGVMPTLLILCGVILSVKTKMWKVLAPKRFIGTLADAPEKNGVSPFRAMCCALAGTLGVGNIAGVATAITAGGAGAVMWMWIGALFSMSVKYGEVALAVKYRQKDASGYYGGSMYTIKNGLCRRIGKKLASALGGVFAVMCIINSLVTGNIVQSNSASAVFTSLPRYTVGAVMALALLVTALCGRDKISSFMSYLIPPLSAIYIIFSMCIIIKNIGLIPNIMGDIIKGAFLPRAAIGGIMGTGVRSALKFGVTRGILSNEAGCGTAPTAHSSANVKSPHHQGCYGIFEVIADTLILCSMTAFVILIGEKKTGGGKLLDGVPLTLDCFESLLGESAYYLIGISVILFAFATIVAQLYYGGIALGYFTRSKIPYSVYVAISLIASFAGALVNVERMWLCADIVVGIMTTVNVVVLLAMRREIKEISDASRN